MHPKPYDNQLLCDWIKDLAKVYEISYPNFCQRILMLTSDEIYDLRSSVPERVLTTLANATGIAMDELEGRDMSSKYRQWDKEYREMTTREKPEIIACDSP